MLNRKPDGRGSGEQNMRPHPELGRLLDLLDSTAEPLPWSDVQRVVAQAPPVRAPWWTIHVYHGARRLRYAMAALALLVFGTGVLAVMPAHSDQVGTLVLTKLPSAWSTGDQVFNEAKDTASRLFNELGVPQSNLSIIIGERAGRDELAFVLMGVDRTAAQGFMNSLCDASPALAAFTAEYSTIDCGRFGSRLNELAYSVSHGGALERLSDEELTAHVLRSLSQAGFGVEKVSIKRQDDGKIIIEVDASLKVTVEMGRTQEDLEAAGLSSELVGEDNFQRLLDEVANP
jgi:hypothetical protein